MDTKAKALFEHGVSAFKNGKYLDSVQLFNEVVASGATAHVVFASRSAAYEKLGKISDALKDARKVIELAPASPQGYIRSSGLFLLAKRPESAQRMIEMASERVAPDDTKPARRLALLRVEIEAELDVQKRRVMKKACHISKLPYEIISEIILYAAGTTKPPQVLNLTAVSAQWRNIAISTPQLWRTLRLRTRNTLEQLALWTQRSGSSHGMQGIVNLSVPSVYALKHDIMSILKAWSQSPRFLQPSAPPLSLVLDEVGWSDWVQFDRCLAILPRTLESITCLGPEHGLSTFHLTADSGDHLRFPYLDLSRSVGITYEFPSLKDFRSLRLREVTGIIHPGFFFEGLRASPNLCELELVSSARTPSPYTVLLLEPVPRSFDCLERVTLAGDGTWSCLLKWLDTPSLKYLDLSVSSHDTCDILSRIWTRLSPPLFAPPLVELRLNRCGVGSNGQSLSALINQLPFLEKLEITGCGDDINPAIFTLAGNCRGGVTVGGDEGPSLPCPRLQYVDFSRCPQVRGISIRDLVKSRLPPTPALHSRSSGKTDRDTTVDTLPTDGSSRPLPLHTVIIDQCPNVSAQLLPWLRQQVPRISCVYETKALAKERMPRIGRHSGL